MAVSNIRIAAVVVARVVSSALFARRGGRGKKREKNLLNFIHRHRFYVYPKDHWAYHATIVVAAVSVRCANIVAVAGPVRAIELRAVSFASARNWRR